MVITEKKQSGTGTIIRHAKLNIKDEGSLTTGDRTVQPTSNKFPSPTHRPPGSTHSILEPSSSTHPRPITTGPAPFEQDIRAPEKTTVSGPMEISPPSNIARAQTTAPAAIRTVESDIPEAPTKNLELLAQDSQLYTNVRQELV